MEVRKEEKIFSQPLRLISSPSDVVAALFAPFSALCGTAELGIGGREGEGGLTLIERGGMRAVVIVLAM